MFPRWPVARTVAFVLFVILAVVALFADVDQKVLWGLLGAGLAALSLS